jgi:signal transduction histidine kinase
MIGAMSTLRRMGGELPPEKHETLMSIALRQGDRLKQLIEDLLMISQVESSSRDLARRNAIDLDVLVGDIAEEFSDARRGGVALSRDLAGLGRVRSDEGKVRQIITNLVENARKYAPSSPVHVSADVVEGPGPRTVAIHVIDSGPGIAPEDYERVFERFVQLDQTATRKQGGTGLGLYLCRLLAAALGGTLTVSAAPTTGCCFTLTLPYDVVDLDDEADVQVGVAAARPFSFEARPLVLTAPAASS